MRFAVIDLGTNSVRFDVHQLSRQGSLKRLHREKLMVRLGQGVFTTGRLNEEAVRRTLQAFRSFQATCMELRVQKVIAFATSALREASDSARLLRLIRLRTRIDVRVISGQEEARLIALGVLKNEKKMKGRFGLIDVGGGSTEVSICQNQEILKSASFDLGTARLQQVFLKRSPPKATNGNQPGPIDLLRAHIRETAGASMKAESWPQVTKVLGSSGTVRALARLIHRIDHRESPSALSFSRSDLDILVDRMSGMTTTQLLELPGMEAKRVDMILSGALLVDEFLRLVGAKKIICTEYSLRDGILSEEIQILRREKERTHLSLHLDDVWKFAKRIGVQENHVRQVLKFSLKMFDELRKKHGLDPKWKDYLQAAAVLHDAGKSVNLSQHEKHSYYIVRNGDLPMMEKWENEFIAQLCLHHKSRKLADVPFRNPRIMSAFQKLLSILRIADALCQDSRQSLNLQRIQCRADQAILFVSGKASVELEKLRLEQRKELFEKIFKLRLALHVAR